MGKAKEFESELGPFMTKDVKSSPRWSKVKPKGDKYTTAKQPLTFDKHKRIVKGKELGKIPKQRVRIDRKEKDMEKTIKAQKFAALVVLAAGAIFGITQYTSDVAVIIGGTLLVALLVEKSK